MIGHMGQSANRLPGERCQQSCENPLYTQLWYSHTETAHPEHMPRALEPAPWSDERLLECARAMMTQLPGTSTTLNRASLFIMRS